MNRGLLYGITAYLLWGLLPLYWRALKEVPALEILSHRVIWSFVLGVVLLSAQRNWKWVKQLAHRPIAAIFLVIAALLLAVNWLTYIWAINAGFVVESSLGYFINPLVNVLLGVIVLHERLRFGQWIAIAVAASGVLYLTVSVGSLPWIGLTLAFTFGFYALIKKKVQIPTIEGYSVEMAALTLPAIGYLLWLGSSDQQSFAQGNPAISLLLIGSGLITAVPLLCFSAAARRLPLSTLGLLQYMAPTMQFILGVTVFGEVLTEARIIGFSIIWAALIIYSLEGVLARRRRIQAQYV